jgi:hypothetical protein
VATAMSTQVLQSSAIGS